MNGKRKEQQAKVFEEIEGPMFAAEIGLASGARMFWKILELNESFRALKTLADESPELVLDRAQAIASQQSNAEFANPHDAALAAYGWALRGKPRLALRALKVLTRVDRVWWARLVEDRLREELCSAPVPVLSIPATKDFGQKKSVVPRTSAPAVSVYGGFAVAAAAMAWLTIANPGPVLTKRVAFGEAASDDSDAELGRPSRPSHVPVTTQADWLADEGLAAGQG